MINGNCTGDDNPDAWYPDQPNGGNPRTVIERIVPETKRAIALCNSCSQKDVCLEEGLKPMNLAFGIWGGLLPAQRIMIAERQGSDIMATVGDNKFVAGPRAKGYTDDSAHKLRQDERRNALSFFSRIKPYLEV